MMSIKEIPKIFDFMLVSLASAEIMPKQSAAHFWVRRPFFHSLMCLILIGSTGNIRAEIRRQ